MTNLDPGECYAVAGLSRSDHLGLLLSGRVSVLNNHSYLHDVEPGQFLDSPEFECSISTNQSALFQVISQSEECKYKVCISYF